MIKLNLSASTQIRQVLLLVMKKFLKSKLKIIWIVIFRCIPYPYYINKSKINLQNLQCVFSGIIFIKIIITYLLWFLKKHPIMHQKFVLIMGSADKIFLCQHFRNHSLKWNMFKIKIREIIHFANFFGLFKKFGSGNVKRCAHLRICL